MSMKENTEMIKEFVDTETGEEKKEPIELLSEQLVELVEHVDKLGRFCAMQCDINNVLRFLIKRKYTQKELEIALKEYEEAAKRLHEDDKKEEKPV